MFSLSERANASRLGAHFGSMTRDEIEAVVVIFVTGSTARGDESVESNVGRFASACAVKLAAVAKTSKTALVNAFIQYPLQWKWNGIEFSVHAGARRLKIISFNFSAEEQYYLQVIENKIDLLLFLTEIAEFFQLNNTFFPEKLTIRQ